MSRKAFQILLANPFPWLHNSSSNKISFPALAESNNPQRTPSAPNFSIKSRGSGELPSDFDILRLWLSLTIPVKYTRSEEHTSELQSRENLVCRLLLEKKK